MVIKRPHNITHTRTYNDCIPFQKVVNRGSSCDTLGNIILDALEVSDLETVVGKEVSKNIGEQRQWGRAQRMPFDTYKSSASTSTLWTERYSKSDIKHEHADRIGLQY